MNRKEKTLNAFPDSDLSTEQHDEIMLWLHDNIKEILGSFDLTVDSFCWEQPLIKGTGQYKSIAGYVDMAATCSYYDTDDEGLFKSHCTALIEVKSHIKSIGELLRQIRQYQTFAPRDCKFFVASPDERFISVLKSQGVEFIKAPKKEPHIRPELQSLLKGG